MLQMQSSAHGAALCCRTLPAGAASHPPAGGGSADAATSVDRQDPSPTDARSSTKTKVEINNFMDFAKAVGQIGFTCCVVIPCGVTKEVAKGTASAALRSVLPCSSESC